jgi:UDP-glucose 4-epimerase
MSQQRTLVVGGGGFIGHALVRRLAAQGTRRVTVLGRSTTPRFSLPATVTYVQGSAGDRETVAKLLRDSDEVIDLAYSTVPKTSFDDPLEDVISNLPNSVSLIQSASHSRIKRYLLVSSGGTVYGHAKYLPIDENHPNDPVSPYGISKLMAEKYALFFHRMEGLPVVVARPSNPYGFQQVGGGQQGFIGAAIHALISGGILEVYGERGTVRDYIYIEDLISGLESLLTDGKAGEVYNIGTGNGHDNWSVLEIIRSAAGAAGKRLNVVRQEARPFDVQANVLDCTKIKATSAWRPLVGLKQGVELTLAEAAKKGLIFP